MKKCIKTVIAIFSICGFLIVSNSCSQILSSESKYNQNTSNFDYSTEDDARYIWGGDNGNSGTPDGSGGYGNSSSLGPGN